MTEDQIIDHLVGSGFLLQAALGRRNLNRDRPRRLEHPSEHRRGSLYAAPDFLAASKCPLRGMTIVDIPTGKAGL